MFFPFFSAVKRTTFGAFYSVLVLPTFTFCFFGAKISIDIRPVWSDSILLAQGTRNHFHRNFVSFWLDHLKMAGFV